MGVRGVGSEGQAMSGHKVELTRAQADEMKKIRCQDCGHTLPEHPSTGGKGTPCSQCVCTVFLALASDLERINAMGKS